MAMTVKGHSRPWLDGSVGWNVAPDTINVSRSIPSWGAYQKQQVMFVSHPCFSLSLTPPGENHFPVEGAGAGLVLGALGGAGYLRSRAPAGP